MELIKILTKNKKDSIFFNLEEVISQLERFSDYSFEITNQFDPNFNGYYLVPYGEILKDKNYLDLERSRNTFILGIPYSSISNLVEKIKPIGLIDSRFMAYDKSNFYGPKDFLEEKNLKTLINYNNYLMSSFTEFQNQENALAQTIIKYITMYDEFIKGE
ncbi:hypothetical protein TOREUM_40753 [Tenacibaculum litoreum]|uniref:hypothetical protein n=1 Tax=Tenacibaculum litoreum TaxID=321269 RepID=UPI00389645E5